MTFGQKIKEIREKFGMTRRHLSDKSGVSYSYLSTLEAGIRDVPPKPETIQKLANVLPISFEELMEMAGYIEDKSSQSLEEILNKDVTFEGKPLSKKEKEIILNTIKMFRN